MQPPPKPLLSRRTSRSKSIPQLTINPSVIELSDKTKDSKDSNKLLHLAEVATSPKSPFHPSPLPLSLTPSLLPESTPDWVLKSPLTKFAFPDKPVSICIVYVIKCIHTHFTLSVGGHPFSQLSPRK